jgi:hypothetical protein
MKTALLVAKVALLLGGALVLSVVTFFGLGLAADHFALRRIDRELHADLGVGDLPIKIEATLAKEKFPFAFDPRQDRYEAIYRPKSMPLIPRGDVCVYVYVDRSKRLTRIEEEMAYTFL